MTRYSYARVSTVEQDGTLRDVAKRSVCPGMVYSTNGTRAPVQRGTQAQGTRGGPCRGESRKLLGVMDELWYNDLDHASAPRTRRSPSMRVKLQLVMCSNTGQEETVTAVITLTKANSSTALTHLRPLQSVLR